MLDFAAAIASIKVDTPSVTVPEVKVPEANVNVSIDPIKVPTPIVNFDASKIRIPKIEMPTEMDIKGWVKLQGVDLEHPLPVQLRDAAGKPYNLLDGFTTILQRSGGGFGGGKSDFFTIKSMGQSAFSEIMNPDGRVKVEMPAGATGLTDTELRASHLDVQQLSGSIDSVWVKGFDATLGANIVDSTGVAYSGSNPVPVSGSVAVSGITGSIGATILNGEGVARDSWLVSDITASVKSALIDSSGIQYSGSNPVPTKMNALESIGTDVMTVRQVSGTSDSVYVTGFGASVGATLLNGEGVARDSWLVSDVTASLKSALVDSSGVQYSGSNPLPITWVSGAGVSTSVNISDSSGIGYSGSNPVPTTPQRALESVGLDVMAVRQVSGATDSVYVTGFGASVGATILNGEGVARDSWLVSDITASIKAALIDSSGIQYSGSNPVPVVFGASATQGVMWVDSTGVAYEGANPAPVYIVSGGSATSATNIVDSTGIAYEGANPFPIKLVSGTVDSLAVNIADSTGIGYSGSNPLPITWVSGAGAGVTTITNIVDDGGIVYCGSNPLPIRVVTDQTATLNTVLVDSGGVGFNGSNGIPVRLGTGTNASLSVHLEDSSGVGYDGSNPMWVRVNSSSASIGATILNGEGIARDSWLVSAITNSVAVNIGDSSGVGYSGSNPLPITWVSGAGAGVTTVSNIVDDGGVVYCGSNPMPVVLAANFASSTITVGAVISDVADDGSAPVKTGGIARTANPTAVAGGDNVSFSADKYGRQLNRPLQVRDQISTAYVALTSGSGYGTETTLLGAAVGVYHELIWILASNSSSAASSIDIRAVTGGSVIMHIEIPGNSTTGIVTPAVPLFGAISDQSGNNWTVDAPDVTGGNIYVSALFSNES